jgi:hypothetical protein
MLESKGRQQIAVFAELWLWHWLRKFAARYRLSARFNSANKRHAPAASGMRLLRGHYSSTSAAEKMSQSRYLSITNQGGAPLVIRVCGTEVASQG